MMTKSNKLTWSIPSPFALGILLTAITAALAWIFTENPNQGIYLVDILQFWQLGFWDLLEFSAQMCLILLLGHIIALSQPVDWLINKLVMHCTSTTKAVVFVSFISIAVSYINWGMCLVVGALLARKVGEYAGRNNIAINYPLIAAAGYTGMMTWHGGLSGSAPLSVAQDAHVMFNQIGMIPVSQTLFSVSNLFQAIALLLIIPLAGYIIAKRFKTKAFIPSPSLIGHSVEYNKPAVESSFFDSSRILGQGLGGLMIALGIYQWWNSGNDFSFINLNYVNFILFGVGLVLHKNLNQFQQAAAEAISGITGILILFPIYAGIMGIMKYSGLLTVIAEQFVLLSNTETLPLYTFFSAAIVNIFIPSGGGQWALQGPIMCSAAQQLGTPLSKIIMAFAYGDQLTNMLQPFWALPLLGITKLKARQILPYSLLFMLVGLVFYVLLLLLF